MKQIDYFKSPSAKAFKHRGCEAIPYNHFCDDRAWIVIVCLTNWQSLMVYVTALEPEEAAKKAIDIYLEEVCDE